MKVFGFFLLGMAFAVALVGVFVLAQSGDDKTIASKPASDFHVYNTVTNSDGSRSTFDDKGNLMQTTWTDNSLPNVTKATGGIAWNAGKVVWSDTPPVVPVARLEAHYVNAERPAELSFNNKGVTVSLVAGIDGSLRFKHADGSTTPDLTDFSLLNAGEKAAIRDVIKALAPK